MIKFIPENIQEFRDELVYLMLNPFIKYSIKKQILLDYAAKLR